MHVVPYACVFPGEKVSELRGQGAFVKVLIVQESGERNGLFSYVRQCRKRQAFLFIDRCLTFSNIADVTSGRLIAFTLIAFEESFPSPGLG